MEVVVVYLHYIGIIAIAVALVSELLHLEASENLAWVRHLAWVDFAYLAAAILVLVTGVLRLLWYGKGPSFYLHNPFFYIKLALFVAIGLISIAPTRYMLRWRRDAIASILPPPEEVAHVRRYVIAELAMFILIPLFAVLAARGIGSQG